MGSHSNSVRPILCYVTGHFLYSSAPSALVFYRHSRCPNPLRTQWAAQEGFLIGWWRESLIYRDYHVMEPLSVHFMLANLFRVCIQSVSHIDPKFCIFLTPSYNPNEVSCFPEWDNGWNLWSRVTHCFVTLDSKGEWNLKATAGGELFGLRCLPEHNCISRSNGKE